MSLRADWVCFFVLTPLLLTVLSTGATAADRIFESLRNQPPAASDRTPDTPSTPQDTQSETDALRLDPILQVFPPLRSDTVLRILPDRTGDSPSLRLILPPGEDAPERSTPSRTKAPNTATRSETRPGGIQYLREVSGRNVTGPFTNRFFVGIRWPGLSVGFHEPPYTVEFKHLNDSPSDITVTGVRLYHHFLPLQRTNYYWGLDLSRINFEGAVSEGDGTSTGLFFGVYREIAPNLSWSLDMGPYYIYLRDDETRISANGLEYTVTTGLIFEVW